MERQSAQALLMYINKCTAFVPTTVQEWETARGAVQALERVANGLATCELHATELKQEPPN